MIDSLSYGELRQIDYDDTWYGGRRRISLSICKHLGYGQMSAPGVGGQ